MVAGIRAFLFEVTLPCELAPMCSRETMGFKGCAGVRTPSDILGDLLRPDCANFGLHIEGVNFDAVGLPGLLGSFSVLLF